jgi:hypothetical protein
VQSQAAAADRYRTRDQAEYSVEIADGRVLALTGRLVISDDAALLHALLGQLRSRRERAVLDGLRERERPA